MQFHRTGLSSICCGASTCAFWATVGICWLNVLEMNEKRFIIETTIPGPKMGGFRDISLNGKLCRREPQKALPNERPRRLSYHT
jgi:hypothetical protein